MGQEKSMGKERGVTAGEAKKNRLTSHWKMDSNPDTGATIWTVASPSIIVCVVGHVLQDDGRLIPDVDVAARIVKTHNEFLLHPNMTKIRTAAESFLKSVGTGRQLIIQGDRGLGLDHLKWAADEFSRAVNIR